MICSSLKRRLRISSPPGPKGHQENCQLTPGLVFGEGLRLVTIYDQQDVSPRIEFEDE